MNEVVGSGQGGASVLSSRKCWVIHRHRVVNSPAPRFRGQDVGPALLALLASREPIPDLHIKLQGKDNQLDRVRILRSRCKHDKVTGHIQVVVRLPGASPYDPHGHRTLHFVRGRIVNPLADIIEEIVVGYPVRQVFLEIDNVVFGIRTIFDHNGESTTIDLVPRVLKERKKPAN